MTIFVKFLFYYCFNSRSIRGSQIEGPWQYEKW